MSLIAQSDAGLGNPAFFFTYAVIQAGVLLILIRYLDFYNRQPLGLVALAAVWGATGAAVLSVAGNEAVKEMLSGDVRDVFGDAIAAPLVEEAAKGIALLAAVGPVRWLAQRAGVSLFEGVGAGIVFGAAVGLGFGFTEDVYFLVDRAQAEGIQAGFDTFLYRRDFFGPAILHHAVFTAAFGAALGLAAWSTRRALKLTLPAIGFALAVAMHAVNNGLVELVVVLNYGIEQAANWVRDPAFVPAAEETAASVTRLMRVIDFYYLVMFFGVIVYWTIRQRRVIRDELKEEVDLGLIEHTDYVRMFDRAQRRAGDWRLLRTGQLEQLRHERRLRYQLAQLGLLKRRTDHFGGSWSRIQRARREIATLSTYEVAPLELPVPASPLIGRERELQDIPDALLRPDVRLVTLTGPGGTGKTRLSIEVASQQRGHFSGGVYFVELAPLTDPELVPKAIADVLQVRAAPTESIVEALGHHLGDKQLLLVLDNFEQVTGAAPAVADILKAARRLKVLATSRGPLRIAGEHEVPVQPLELPDPEAGAAPGAVAGSAAVALFVDRARAVNPDFELTAANAAAVVEICVRLDGLPLAIELAAARTSILTPEEMLERLERRLHVLTGGARDLPSRHQTMRSAIDWSYDLLERREQVLFARLGVFVDGMTLGAVEAVCLDPDESPDAAIDGLASLLDKSLVRRQDGVGGKPRFAMLEMIREYAAERLRADGDPAALRERHARHFAELAEKAEPDLVSADQSLWLKRLDQEVGNLRAALQWSADTGQLELGLRIVSALPRYWSMRHLTDPPRWLSAALEHSPDVPESLRAKALFADGYAALDRGDYARAEDRFEASTTVYRELEDDRGAAACLAQLGFLLMSRGERERAVELSEESLELARRVHDLHIESVALSTLADGATRSGDLGPAMEMYEQSLALRRELGDRRNIANALLNLGRVELLRGEDKRARAMLEEGLAVGREVGDTWSISVALASLGRLALRQGRHTQASDLLGQALQLALERGGIRVAAECLAALAEAASIREPARAAWLFGAAEALRRSTGVSLSPVELAATRTSFDGVREALGEDEFGRQREAGLEARFEDAVAYALSASQAE